MINEGQFEKAQDLTNTTYPRTAPKDLNYGMPYQTMGDLFLDFKGHENFKNYTAARRSRRDFNSCHQKETGDIISV